MNKRIAVGLFFATVIMGKVIYGFTEEENRKMIVRTTSCHDCDYIPKVGMAGQIIVDHGTAFQIMHNGIKIKKDAYAGSMMTIIIEKLRGHHEPQEEKIFYEVLKTLPEDALMIEVGCNWAYYSMWFQKTLPKARNFLIEPDAQALALGIYHCGINDVKGEFIQAAVGTYPGVSSINLADFVHEKQLPFIAILHSDIQGAEVQLLRDCEPLMNEHKIGYFFVSTHGDRDIHPFCLNFLQTHGFRIIANHTVAQSFSYDGLIVAQDSALKPLEPLSISLFNNTISRV